MSFIDIDRYGFKKSIDLIVWPLNTFMATSRLVFDQAIGYHSPAKLIHRINHHSVLAFHPCHKLAFPSFFLFKETWLSNLKRSQLQLLVPASFVPSINA